MPSSSSSSNNNNQNIFHSYPQKYPLARRKAAEMLRQVHEITKKGPRSLIAQVVDTSFHISQGYVTCTTLSGVVQVLGIPYGSVVSGMRVYARQIGSHSTNHAYLFDGYAPNVSGLGSSSGSFTYSAMFATSLTQGLAMSAATAVPTVSGMSSSTGYFWSCFFYIPQLPTSTTTLFQMYSSTATVASIALEMTPTGLLRVRSSDGHGYITNAPISPHNVHYVQVQPQNTGNELLVDTVSNYTGITVSTDDPTFSGNATGYQLSLLSNHDGSQLAPLGTWLSKFGFGTSYVSSVVVALPNVVPTSDSTLPVNAGGKGYYSLLCGDSVGASTLSNSAAYGSGTATTLVNTTNCVVGTTGPY